MKKGRLKRLFWFLLANAAIVLSVSIISAGALVSVVPFILIFSCIFPFLALMSSRWLAKRAHGIYLIGQNSDDEDERALYALVASLANRAGLKRTPEVGIYRSADMNAFATGPSRNRSLVAFSTALLENMDDRSIAAVTAHEISHIANGDMITLALVQSVVNAIINLITIPLSIIKLVALFDDNFGVAAYWLFSLFKFLFTLFLVFLGSLVVFAFSRHREFKADALAARLLDKESMIGALVALSHDTAKPLKKHQPYAALKISSPRRFLDIFSTHPSINRRIKALEKLII